jgi:predicted dehydrogenase
MSVCDVDKDKLQKAVKITHAIPYRDSKRMLIEMKGKMDLVVIATPNFLHHSQALEALNNGYDVLIEKPVAFSEKETVEIARVAKENKKQAYAVLQVRYNPAVQFLKKVVEKKLLGKIRLINLTLLWQRPQEYFKTWRGSKILSGGILYEIGVHYLDILQWVFGKPRVLSANTFKLKNKKSTAEDTVFSTLKFGKDVLGNIEITTAAEPHNLECSISVLGEKGFLKIGGVALNKIEAIEIDKNVRGKSLIRNLKNEKQPYSTRKANNYGNYIGSSPNHPVLYKELIEGRGISVLEAAKSIRLIESVYSIVE